MMTILQQTILMILATVFIAQLFTIAYEFIIN